MFLLWGEIAVKRSLFVCFLILEFSALKLSSETNTFSPLGISGRPMKFLNWHWIKNVYNSVLHC